MTDKKKNPSPKNSSFDTVSFYAKVLIIIVACVATFRNSLLVFKSSLITHYGLINVPTHWMILIILMASFKTLTYIINRFCNIFFDKKEKEVQKAKIRRVTAYLETIIYAIILFYFIYPVIPTPFNIIISLIVVSCNLAFTHWVDGDVQGHGKAAKKVDLDAWYYKGANAVKVIDLIFFLTLSIYLQHLTIKEYNATNIAILIASCGAILCSSVLEILAFRAQSSLHGQEGSSDKLQPTTEKANEHKTKPAAKPEHIFCLVFIPSIALFGEAYISLSKVPPTPNKYLTYIIFMIAAVFALNKALTHYSKLNQVDLSGSSKLAPAK